MRTILNQLFQHHTLTREDARQILIKIAHGEYNSSQLAAFLTVFQLRNITLDELQGFRDALQELSILIDLSDFNTIDLCGTGGDQKDTFNISTLASFVVAGAGEKVVKHGNYGVSSTCGSSNVLEYFGYKFSSDISKLKNELEGAGICFLHAPVFNPAMKNIAPIRRELSVKTFFNMLGPMINPASPKNQLIGVFNLELARMYNYIYQPLDVNYHIVHSLDGYDEISLTGGTQIQNNNGVSIVSPKELGFNTVLPEEIKGGKSIKESAQIFMDILSGKGTAAQQNVVIANAGVALKTIHHHKSYDDCFDRAKDSLMGKKALQCFKKLLND